MLVEKEVIAPGAYWYVDEATGLPRKLSVTSDLTRYWHEQGRKMLSAGLTIPVPYEHDFSAHPMTPKDKLLNNSGWVSEYRIRDAEDPITKEMRKDVLFGVIDIQDPEVAKKLPRTIRWTSPWINSFTDGQGHEWKNVISHLALTTRPRITKQAPFAGIAAALSLATEVAVNDVPKEGYCLSKAGRLVGSRKDRQNRLLPQFPIAFSIWAGGISLDFGGIPSKKKSKDPTGAEQGGDPATDPATATEEPSNDTGSEDDDIFGSGGDNAGGEGGGVAPPPPIDMSGLMNPLQDSQSDIKIEEICRTPSKR